MKDLTCRRENLKEARNRAVWARGWGEESKSQHDVMSVSEVIQWHDIPALEKVDRELLERHEVPEARALFSSCNEKRGYKTWQREE